MTARSVQLSREDLSYAAHVGVCRRVESLASPGRYGAPTRGPQLWGQDIDATCAELAVALLLDRPWTGAEPKAAADVGDCYQVRHTHHPDGRLIVHKEDADDHVFVLATGTMGCFCIHGWMFGYTAKDPKWWCEPRGGYPAFFVPRSELGRMETLLP